MTFLSSEEVSVFILPTQSTFNMRVENRIAFNDHYKNGRGMARLNSKEARTRDDRPCHNLLVIGVESANPNKTNIGLEDEMLMKKGFVTI